MERKYYDLSPSQKILFFYQKFSIYKQVNNICTSVILDTQLDFEILKKAIQKSYDRNDSLRIRIVKVGKEMKQYFLEHDEPDIRFLDFRGKTRDRMDRKLDRLGRKPVSVFGKQMSRVYMFKAHDGRSGICFVVSHIIMDAWAIALFYKDVLAVYDAMVKGIEMPKPLSSFEELLVRELNYKNTEAYRRDREFFEKMFSKDEPIYTDVNGYTELEKYRKKKKNPNLRYAGGVSIYNLLFARAGIETLIIPKELVEKMNVYCTANKVTIQSLIFLAVRNYFSRVNRYEKDITLLTIVARRGSLAEKNAGGTRPHFIPLRTILEEGDTFKRGCEIITEKQNAIYRHAEIDSLEVQAMWHKAYDVPQFASYGGTSVSFQPVRLEAPDGVKIESKLYSNGLPKGKVYFTIMDGDGTGALKIYCEYNTHLVSADTIQKMHSYLLKSIEEGITEEGITIGEILRIE